MIQNVEGFSQHSKASDYQNVLNGSSIRLKTGGTLRFIEGSLGSLSTRMAIFLKVVFVSIFLPFAVVVGAKRFVCVQSNRVTTSDTRSSL